MHAELANRFVAAALVIVAILAVLGHVCVLPVHAHAAPVEHHGSHGDEPAQNSVHSASCDALKTAAAMPLIAPAATWAALAVVEAVSFGLVDYISSGSHAESPPLFLLHSALLI